MLSKNKILLGFVTDRDGCIDLGVLNTGTCFGVHSCAQNDSWTSLSTICLAPAD